MPRERLDIRLFNKGMIPNVDTTDLDNQAAAWCYNVDLSSREGQLIGVPGDESKTVAIGAVGDVQGYGWIEKTDGTRTLAYFDKTDSKVKRITDFNGTPGAITDVSSLSSYDYLTFVRRHQSLRASGFISGAPGSTPNWWGYTDNSIFGSSSTALITQNQECKVMSGLTSNGYFKVDSSVLFDASSDGYFTPNKRYYYRFALEYDGYQISVLDQDAYVLDDNYVDTGTATLTNVIVTIRAYAAALIPGDFNKRITGIILFRADGPDTATTPTTSFRFVTRITVDGTGWSTSGDDKTYAFTDTGVEGNTFEAYSGLAETATNSILPWAIGCAADNYMFIGNCTSSIIDDAQYMIFRSVAGRYDVYDFESANPSFVKLGIRPLAMCFYFGRLLVFDGSHMVRINPDTLSIEDIVEGYGCLNQQSLCITPYGVFFADKNGINFYDGKNISRITQAIFEFPTSLVYNTGSGNTTISDHSYRTISASITYSNPLRIAYHSRFDMLIVSINHGGTIVTYGYSIGSRGWTLLSVPQSAAANAFGYFTDQNSELYMGYRHSSTNYLYKVMSDFSNRRVWEWISQRLTFTGGSDDIYQKFYYIYSADNSSLSKFYGIDDGVMGYSFSSPDGEISASYRRAKSLRFYLASTAVNKYINSISVIYRRMIGER